jgi:hypothetical protein
VDAVPAVDPDAQEVLVRHDADLRVLEPPRLTSADTATWHATEIGLAFGVAYLVTGNPPY